MRRTSTRQSGGAGPLASNTRAGTGLKPNTVKVMMMQADDKR